MVKPLVEDMDVCGELEEIEAASNELFLILCVFNCFDYINKLFYIFTRLSSEPPCVVH